MFIDYNDRVKPDQVPKDMNKLIEIFQGKEKFSVDLLRPRWRYHAFRDESRFEGVIGGEFLDFKKAREKYTIDPDNQIQPRDELILAGNLDVSIEGVLKDPRSRVDVVVKLPATRSGETEYAYGETLSLPLGEKGTWEKVPAGEVIIEASRGGKILTRREKVEISKAQNEVPLRAAETEDEDANLEEGWYVLKFEQILTRDIAAQPRPRYGSHHRHSGCERRPSIRDFKPHGPAPPMFICLGRSEAGGGPSRVDSDSSAASRQESGRRRRRASAISPAHPLGCGARRRGS